MKPTGHHYEIRLNAAGKWYWRRVSRNGQIQYVAQPYYSKSNAKRAILRIDPNATITVIHMAEPPR